VVSRTLVTCAVGAVLWAAGPATSIAKEIVLSVPGIPGPYCAYGIEKRVMELDGVEEVKLSWESQQITIVMREQARITADEIKQAVRKADYPYKYEIRMSE
jgi:copper chaperone CopZ